MLALVDRWPRLRRAFWWSELVEAAITRAWLTNLGQRTALERTAHLFCELCWRLDTVGLAHNGVLEMPFTQIELADTLGLSPVHVNRTLQELRRLNLIVLRERELTVRDLEALSNVAQFDPAYLHLEDRASDRALRRA